MNATSPGAAGPHHPIIATSIADDTAACVRAAAGILAPFGFDIALYAADGVGGRKLQRALGANSIAGLFDVSLAEFGDELLGGVRAISGRLDDAARTGTPAVYAPGGLDAILLDGRESLPAPFRQRRQHAVGDGRTLARTDPDENAKLGRTFAEKINESTGPVAVFLPLRGVSSLSGITGPLHWPEADAALFTAIRTHLRKHIPVYEMDVAINDLEFSRVMAEGLLAMAPARRGPTPVVR
jgi:uncharacterized protein (UPF0261 family)